MFLTGLSVNVLGPSTSFFLIQIEVIAIDISTYGYY